MDKQSKVNYLAFLLRMWREDEFSPWRASLENPRTGVREGFANTNELFEFLKKLLFHSLQKGVEMNEYEE